MSQPAAEEHAAPGEEPTELKRVMGPEAPPALHRRRHPRHRRLRAHRRRRREVGGAAWAPFIVAFPVALVTAFSYLELVTKYPRAAGAALYTHKAFGVHLLTFMVVLHGHVFRHHVGLDRVAGLRLEPGRWASG